MHVRDFLIRVIVAAVLLAAHAEAASAQCLAVNGRVTLRQPGGNDVPVQGALVEFYRTDIRSKFMVKTDGRGNYIHACLPLIGYYTIIVSAPGARPSFVSGARVLRQQEYNFTLMPGDGSRLTLEEVAARSATGDAEATAPATRPEPRQKEAAAEERAEADSAQRGVKVLTGPTAPALPAVAGSYYALVIGNNRYQHLKQLRTAAGDAQAVASLLQSRYGFKTKLLLDANRQEILRALNEYRRSLEPSASLFIYYAGHGYRDEELDTAYWLPVDADEDDNANWISADDVTKNIKGIPARHILVVSDSCYSGALVRDNEMAVATPRERERYLSKMLAGRSRRLISSGGNEPVADSGGSGHSVFAGALLRGLTEMDRDVFTARELFDDFIQEAVAGRSNQTPDFSPIRNSGTRAGISSS